MIDTHDGHRPTGSQIIDPEIARNPMGRPVSRRDNARPPSPPVYRTGARTPARRAGHRRRRIHQPIGRHDESTQGRGPLPHRHRGTRPRCRRRTILQPIAGYSFSPSHRGSGDNPDRRWQQIVGLIRPTAAGSHTHELIEEVPGTTVGRSRRHRRSPPGAISPTTSLRPPRPWRLRASPWSLCPASATTMRRRSSPTTYRRTAYASRSWTATSSATLTCS